MAITVTSDITFDLPKNITTFEGGSTARIKRISSLANGTISAFADAGGGIVTVSTASYTDLADGEQVKITGTTNYNGFYVVSNVVSGVSFDITATFVASETGSAFRLGAIPVKLEATSDINLNDVIRERHYLWYKAGATLDTYESRRINSISDIVNSATGTATVDSTDKTKVTGTGTAFTTEITKNAKITINGEERVVKSITNNTELYVWTAFTEAHVGWPFTYKTYEITLQNPLGEDWDDFPVTNTLCQYTKEDNIRFVDDFKIQMFFEIVSASVETLVFDIEFTQAAAEDLNVELAAFDKEVTKETVRTGDIFDDDNYVDLAKDISSAVSQNIYTVSDTSGDFKLRIPLDVNLTDQIVRITLYPDDYNAGGPSGSNSVFNVNVRKNVLGYRSNLDFYTV